ncbi:tripartite tricarboxylate transporter TctB family protein [Cohaesibacter celericrescens]|uniref:C4-dicarboxylate ABC transporter permease n=1 Tax=Cohaesibacter celericrescens TaxID=2067669 RepID=A0A2N5XNL1_9HYPH|nr:tripartite tricarboxylate transporter TctB family protein [Cohaesibacter celericrescens]PLW76065.1 C4-dicarboxylate ABC transporter permease [Cohaesibacter celericrescens]
MTTIPEYKSDIWIGTCLLVFCAATAWITVGIKGGMSSSAAGPSLIPWMMIGGITLLSLILIGRAGRAKAHAPADGKMIEFPDAHTLLIIAAFTLLLIAYATAFYPVGYIPATLVTFVVGLWLLGERNWTVLFLFPVGMTLAVYYGFTELLSVWLP